MLPLRYRWGGSCGLPSTNVIAPLIRHGRSYPWISPTAFLPTIGTRRHLPYALLALVRCWRGEQVTSGNMRRDQRRQVLEPKARSLGFPMPEHPWLNRLVWLADSAGDDAHRVLKGDVGNRSVQQCADELQRGLLPSVCDLLGKVACARDREVGARGVRDHQIPRPVPALLFAFLPAGAIIRPELPASWVTCSNAFQSILFQMPALASFGRDEIARPRIEAARPEGIAHRRAVFAGD